MDRDYEVRDLKIRLEESQQRERDMQIEKDTGMSVYTINALFLFVFISLIVGAVTIIRWVINLFI